MKQYFLGVLTALVVTLTTQAISQQYEYAPGEFSENAEYILSEARDHAAIMDRMNDKINELSDVVMILQEQTPGHPDFLNNLNALSNRVDDYWDRTIAFANKLDADHTANVPGADTDYESTLVSP